MIEIKRTRLLEKDIVFTSCFFVALLGMFSLCASASAAPKKLLSVNARIIVKWNHTVEEYHKTEGSLSLQINGIMKWDAAASPPVRKSKSTFMPVLTYKPQVMSVSYTYDETKTSLRPIPKGAKCQDPMVYEYNGGGVSQIFPEDVPRKTQPAGLKIIRFNSMASPYLKNLSPDKKKILAGMKVSMMMPDYYEFYVGGPGRKKIIPGRKKDEKEEACVYLPTKKPLPGFQMGLQVKLPQSGVMKGSRTWSADDQGMNPPPLGIAIYDIVSLRGNSPLKPPEGGNKNVTYTVSWDIQKAEEYIPVTVSTEDEEKPCEVLEKRIRKVQLRKKLFQNKKVKRYCKEQYGESDYVSYNETVEKIAEYISDQEFETYEDAADFVADLDSNEISAIDSRPASEPTTTMETEVVYDDDKHVDEVLITDTLNGQDVPIMEFPSGDFGSARKTGYYDEVRNAYEQDFFESGTGRNMFQSEMAREMSLSEQYLGKDGPPESIDEFSDWKETAIKEELDRLIEAFKESGC